MSDYYAQQEALAFCGADNVYACSKYIQAALDARGLPALDVQQMAVDTGSSIDLLNVLYKLLDSQRADSHSTNTAETRMHRALNDLSLAKQANERLKDEIEGLRRREVEHDESTRKLTKKCEQLTEAAKVADEEMKKARIDAKRFKTQCQHEVKKMERDFSKMKEKMAKVLSDKSAEKRVGMEILNTVQRQDGKRGLWAKGNKSEDMQRVVISKFEEREKELSVENETMRASLLQMEDQLVELLKEVNATRVGMDESQLHDFEEPTQAHFQMPYLTVKEDIENSIRSKMHAIKSHVTRMQSVESPSIPDNDEQARALQTLQQKIDEYKSEISTLQERLATTQKHQQQQHHLSQSTTHAAVSLSGSSSLSSLSSTPSRPSQPTTTTATPSQFREVRDAGHKPSVTRVAAPQTADSISLSQKQQQQPQQMFASFSQMRVNTSATPDRGSRHTSYGQSENSDFSQPQPHQQQPRETSHGSIKPSSSSQSLSSMSSSQSLASIGQVSAGNDETFVATPSRSSSNVKNTHTAQTPIRLPQGLEGNELSSTDASRYDSTTIDQQKRSAPKTPRDKGTPRALRPSSSSAGSQHSDVASASQPGRQADVDDLSRYLELH